MTIKNVDINKIKPYENNPRINENAVDKVVNSIKEFGFQNPIIVDKDGVIIAGHTRYKASQKLGLKEVPVIVAENLTEEQAKAYRLVDNKTSEFAEWDENKLNAELYELLNNFKMEDFGFEFDDINPDEFGTDFDLPDGDKSDIEQMTFTLHKEQAEFIRNALEYAKKHDMALDYDTNTNSNGNALYGVVKQWDEQKK